MMPVLALIGVPGPRGLWPIPVPLFLLWPVALAGLGMVRFLNRDRPAQAALRTALQAFRELRGLTIEVETANRRQLRIRVV